MKATDFRAIRGVRRNYTHSGRGVAFEVTLNGLPAADPGREYRCSLCQWIIAGRELESIEELLETIRDLRQGAAHHRLQHDAPSDPG